MYMHVLYNINTLHLKNNIAVDLFYVGYNIKLKIAETIFLHIDPKKCILNF